MPAVLLDTNAVIFIANNAQMRPAARQAIVKAAQEGGVLVSPVSAWEIGMLAAKGRVAFLPDANRWFRDFLAGDGVRLAALTPEAAIASSFLPGAVQGDPADRLLIATARALDVPIVTRDKKILQYARTRHVQAIAC